VGDAAGTEDGGPSGGDGGGGAGGILSAETHSTCTLRANGKVACWGSNNEGQLGDGTRDPRLTFVEVANLPAVVEVGVSSDHACARKSDGTVLCWGEATEGKLGDGDADAGRLYSLTPVTVKGLADAVELGSGQHHTCARRSAGTVVCWGNNGFGTLGDGTNEDRAAPVEVPGLTDVVQLSASYFSCARHATGKVSCWGSPNEDGELGNGTTEPSRVPVEVVGLSDAVEISAGGYHVCARRANGTVVCWGSNNSGRLGIGNTDSSGGALKPGESVLGLTDAVQISAGHTSSCALRATGAVVCWGSNGYGQIGNGATDVDVGTPTAVTGLTDAVAITVGQWHACARRATGAVVCWGSNGSAQIGDGTKTERSVPTPVAGLP
jgi:alpha-tubulin suppressor-like RCC1 family protein